MSHLFKKSEETLGDKHRKEENHDHHGNEEGKKNEKGSVGFWSSELKKVRGQVFKKWAITTLILSTFILCVLSLYWAVLFRVPENIASLTIWIIDFDSQVAPYTSTAAIVGPQLVAAALAMNSAPSHLGWTVRSPADFDFDPIAVRNQVFHEHAWAAIVINPNATTLLQDAVANGNASYDPMGAAQVVYIEARDETVYANYITPMLLEFQSTFTSMFGRQWVSTVLSNPSTNIAQLQSTVPQALNPAIGFSTFNLRPFTPPVTTPAITIGLIYLIIISFFSFSFYLPIHMLFITPNPEHKRNLHFYQVIIWRLVATITAYFFLSLFYSLISLAFQIPFSAPRGSTVEVVSPATRYGRASFVVYWMVNWVGMISLGLACENMAMILGQPWTAFWLIFWVITNVSTSFYNIALSPGFYKWGYAWPLHNIVEASRTVLFDIHSRIGLNFGILFVWCAIDIALFPIAAMFMRWKTMKGKKKEQEQKEKEGKEKEKGGE